MCNPECTLRFREDTKILYHNLEDTIDKGVQQTADYAQQCGAEEAHLLIFNRHKDVAWDDKIWRRDDREVGKQIIGIWGM